MISPSDLNIVFFGNERLSTGLPQITPQALPGLVTHGYKVMALISSNRGTHSHTQATEVEEYASYKQIPIFNPHQPIDLLSQMAALKPSIGVLVAYGRIIPQAVLDLFPYGIINIHPSLLPIYRGSTPIEQAILDGATKTGVSIMSLTKVMDAGPILAQRAIDLRGDEQKNELADKLLSVGVGLILPLLKNIEQSLNNSVTQNDQEAIYTSLIKKSDGLIDWNKSAEQLNREVRAYWGWPGSHAQLAGKGVIITASRTLNAQGTPGKVFRHEKQLAVYAGKNALIIDKLKPLGKREMTGMEYLAGNPIAR